ncbi:MAG: 2'-5' RNA ligase family protein [Actinomycetota bacterium]|nr:2'-5' RNA ligase family protein [Actinomycetota bacterium]
MPTIGVAIAVPEPYGEELRRHRSSLGDPQAEAVPTHVTLLPPTYFSLDELGHVAARLSLVADKHLPFEMRLRGTATFRPVSPVVFVSLTQGISECELLAEAVRGELARKDLRYPYHPHVTVAHDLPDVVMDTAFESLAGYEATFSVATFAMYVHDQTNGWVREQEFDLRGGTASG